MKTWTTKDGKELKIKDMDTSHIIHCLKYLESKQAPTMYPYMDDDVEISDEYIVAFEKELKIREEVENLWI